jgi:hypothetical protein
VLTGRGFQTLREAAPGHVEAVRRTLFDRLSAEQVEQLAAICAAVLGGRGAPPPHHVTMD